MNENIYKSIAQRTDGDIYIGVVGPVRTGKSTLIKQFMNRLVIPNLKDKSKKERALDELPQSSGGKTIMTTEPKFIPEEAVSILMDDNTHFRMRLIDCVGYVVPSAVGYIEENSPRMVMTPWFDKEIPFNMAAEIGTRKVITEHSTIGIVVTTDGSFSNIPRKEYEICEEKVINELKELNKPFVVVFNCQDSESDFAKKQETELSEKYNCPVIALNCLSITENDIQNILTKVLSAFPVKEIIIDAPAWLPALDSEHWLKKNIFNSLRESFADIKTIKDTKLSLERLKSNENIRFCQIKECDLGNATVTFQLKFDDNLFFNIIGETTGLEIHKESDLLPILSELCEVKRKYEKIASALEEVEATGYGIVMPDPEELTLEEPEIIKQGGKYGVRLKASAPSIHLMRAGIKTTVSPIVGTEKQSEELIHYLLDGFEDNPAKIWQSNIFGKSLFELVNEGLHNKLYKMPTDARMKLQETLERVINEGCCGLICFIL